MSELRKRRSNLPTMFVGAFALAAIATAMPALPAASADRALPFPSQAVKDAQILLDVTNNRWQTGEATADELALARYNVLEMKYRAGQFGHDAFCQAAKRELQTVAGAFEEQDGQTGQKAKWQSQVARMTATPAACDNAVATTDALMFGTVDGAPSAADVKAAEDAAKEAERRMAMGLATHRDAVQAQYHALEVKYGAKLMTREAYCAQGLPYLHTVADAVAEENRVGQSPLQDVFGAKRALYVLMATCGAG
jgi:hypothetical protein